MESSDLHLMGGIANSAGNSICYEKYAIFISRSHDCQVLDKVHNGIV